ncbi:nitroreductase family protein [Neobacillus notoginsengisoli]|uniref:Nitroreductase family protein n=1 Tax=Neobacillus notoginsengisoli TaxID=1578198 RepID=A0A417YVR3_9BACI|nr:nitroreductase family protein [Neobacillus notoginsengisoli]RHW41472.1 nitroreductase family protein [Neobacillus notoginsengisoli]
MIVSEQTLSSVIQERRSVRKYDPSFKISRDEIIDILQEATLAPSSNNLQPWKFLVFTDEEVKKELRGIAFNQEQVETASAVIAVLGDAEMYHNIEDVYRSAYEAGYMEEKIMERMIENTSRTYQNASHEVREHIATFDAGLVSMQLMLIAKARGYDTVPMGGYNKELFKERFDIGDRYIPTILIALGKAAAPGRPTTRFPVGDVVEFI